MKSIEMPPFAPTLMESTRAIGYSLDAAIADIIDNSIAAAASRVDIHFIPSESPYVSIIDNGRGMDSDEISMSMQYGSRSPSDIRDETDLGRFGLGLKTASLSQCRILTVVSKQGDELHARRWDLDHVNKSERWSLLVLDEKEWRALPHINDLLELENGTMVLWQDLDRLKIGASSIDEALRQKMELARDHISLVFHRYLAGECGKFSIYMNNSIIEPTDPFIRSKSSKPMADEIIMLCGHKVIVTPYILPHASKITAKELELLGGKDGLRKNQGFYIYRNKRLIVWGTWFRMMRKAELSKLARIQVDIPNVLDELWTLDIKKSEAIPPAEVRMNLGSIIEKLAGVSKRTWTYRGKKETDSSSKRVWERRTARDGGVFYTIDRDHPSIALIASQCSNKQAFEATMRQIEMGLPINQMYIDLENDASIANDADMPEHEVEIAITHILESFKTVNEHNSMIDQMLHIEPFMRFLDMLDRHRIKGEGIKI